MDNKFFNNVYENFINQEIEVSLDKKIKDARKLSFKNYKIELLEKIKCSLIDPDETRKQLETQGIIQEFINL
ncbi:hypothetical protein HCN44_002052 [Aphidius gifuensis]|uniref:Uncharacterized protein n=1 Tax=Aphidius gifuensis TaxID=684658 RepID=A0A834XZC7_APHGI|nr:hypothetical protein HCN44_002052 [Aphidius gifuensis]